METRIPLSENTLVIINHDEWIKSEDVGHYDESEVVVRHPDGTWGWNR